MICAWPVAKIPSKCIKLPKHVSNWENYRRLTFTKHERKRESNEEACEKSFFLFAQEDELLAMHL